jgi:hypothetical protein
MRVRHYHKSILISEHAKQRFLERLNIDITKHISIDMSKLPAVAVRTLRDNLNDIVTHYLARIKNEDVLLVVKESDIIDRYETQLITVITRGQKLDYAWDEGINKLNNKLKSVA